MEKSKMKKNVLYVLLSFCVMALVFPQTKISYEEILETALNNSFDIRVKAAAVTQAAGQLNNIKTEDSFIAGLEYQHKGEKVGIDPNDKQQYDPMGTSSISKYTDSRLYHITAQESQNDSAGLFIQKIFDFGLQAKISLNLERTKKSSDYETFEKWNSSVNVLPSESARNTGTISLEFSLPLLKSFNNSLQALKIEEASQTLNQMKQELEDAINRKVISVTQAYFNLYASYNKLMVLREIQENLQQRVEAAEQLKSAGSYSNTNVLAAKISLKNNQRQIIEANAEYYKRILELVSETGSQLPKDVVPEEKINLQEIINYTADFIETSAPSADMIKKIINERADILALKSQVNSKDASLRAAKSSVLPDVNLFIGGQTKGNSYSDNFGDFFASPFKEMRAPQIYGGISVKANLDPHYYNGKIVFAQGQADEAKSRLDEKLFQLENAILYDYNNLLNYCEYIRQSDEIMEMQIQKYEDEKLRFANGLINIDTMIDRENEYIQAVVQHNNSMMSFIAALLQYKYSTNTLSGFSIEPFAKD